MSTGCTETRQSCPFFDFDYCTEFMTREQIAIGNYFVGVWRSAENEGILLANLGGQGSQPGKTGNPGLGQRPFLEPSPQPVHIDGCRGGQVL